jgi:DNA-directed RNA polymerase alpha subunit
MQADLTHILKVLDKMAQLEMTISQFYQAAAAAFPEDAAFWQRLSKGEVHHADHMKKIADILKKTPQAFETGRPLNETAIDFFITNVKTSKNKLASGGFNPRQLLFTALDLEQSILESRYMDILKTQNIEYQTLMAEIVQETQTHKGHLLDKIETLK